uniref:G/T mismatch-specific thymine DNA glycosylase n=1 Tax=Salarias fasciatus TaxID=181472 RepID=A0A672J0H0_SALFA
MYDRYVALLFPPCFSVDTDLGCVSESAAGSPKAVFAKPHAESHLSFDWLSLLSVPAVTPVKKKRGRPPKHQVENGEPHEEDDEMEAVKKAKRAQNRFNGLSVAEVMTKTLPDVITYNLDILIIGINPGLMSAFKGHHYPNPGNHFWKCLFLSGLTDQQLNYMHDHTLPEKYSIGFTNMVERTTPGSKDLSSKEIREGGRQLLEKLQKYKPLIAAFNGKGIYEIFCKETFGVKAKNLDFGLQPYKIPETETVCYLMPSSSPRCAQFPRAQDKVHFYIKLKELRDQMKGLAPSREVLETEYSFDLQLAKEDAKRLAIKEEKMDPEYESCSGMHADTRQSTEVIQRSQPQPSPGPNESKNLTAGPWVSSQFTMSANSLTEGCQT